MHNTGDAMGLTTISHRAVLWEIEMARGQIANFRNLLTAHSIILSLLVTVNLIGFLQPSKGWLLTDVPDIGGDHAPDTKMSTSTMYMESPSVRAFAMTNSLSLYSAITGLLFYIYCTSGDFLSLELVSVRADMIYDEQGINFLHNLRACLQRVALPAVHRRSRLLFCFLMCSLLFSGMAFVSAGLAAVGHKWRKKYVVYPAIPGCLLVFGSLLLVLVKHHREMEFHGRLDMFWKDIAGIDGDKIPKLRRVSSDIYRALDPAALIYRVHPTKSLTRESHHNGTTINGDGRQLYFKYPHGPYELDPYR